MPKSGAALGDEPGLATAAALCGPRTGVTLARMACTARQPHPNGERAERRAIL